MLSAGEITIYQNKISKIDWFSGHYQPSKESFIMGCVHLFEQGLLNPSCNALIGRELLSLEELQDRIKRATTNC